MDSGGLLICHLGEKSNDNPKICISVVLEACLSKKKPDKVAKYSDSNPVGTKMS